MPRRLAAVRPLAQPIALVLAFCVSLVLMLMFPDQWWWVVQMLVVDAVVFVWLVARVLQVLPWEKLQR